MHEQETSNEDEETDERRNDQHNSHVQSYTI